MQPYNSPCSHIYPFVTSSHLSFCPHVLCIHFHMRTFTSTIPIFHKLIVHSSLHSNNPKIVWRPSQATSLKLLHMVSDPELETRDRWGLGTYGLRSWIGNWVYRSLVWGLAFPGASDDKEPACNIGVVGLIPQSGRSPGEGNEVTQSSFLPGEFQGQRSLVGYTLWNCWLGHDWATNTNTQISVFQGPRTLSEGVNPAPCLSIFQVMGLRL